jgi:periplasmic protein TonB
MLRTLLESQATPSRRAGGTLISVAVHSGVIALAIVTTARATSAPSRVEPPKPPIYVVPPTTHPHPPAERNDDRRNGRTVLKIPGTVLVPPVHLSNHLPPIDLTKPPTDEGLFDGKHIRLAIGVQGGGGLASPSDGIYTPSTVEKAAAPMSGNPAPVYPPALRAAQLEGTVIARFVVDSTGRAEAASIVFPEASHTQFADAVRQALLRSRYLPAIVAGRPVRQLVEQRFAFTLTR